MSYMGRATNYYSYLSQKTFTGGQVMEIFAALLIGGGLIYAGYQLRDNQEIFKKRLPQYLSDFDSIFGLIIQGLGLLIIVLGIMRLRR